MLNSLEAAPQPAILMDKRGQPAGAFVMDLAFSSTIELAAAIAARNISAVEALDVHLAQIDRHNESGQRGRHS